MEFGKGYSTKINDRFTIHIAEGNEEELEVICKLNTEIHQKEILDIFLRQIILEHPRKNEILWLYIKDNKRNKVVSSICLAPMEWQIEDKVLPVCEMEFVGTLEHYRGKGFIKILNELYEKIMNQNGYILSVIKGVPYFYRNLGYEFISSLDERIVIPASKIQSKEIENITIRKANSKDLPFIESKYNQFHNKFYMFKRFESECFKFMYLRDQFNSEVRTTYIFDNAGEKSNYFSFGMSYDNQNYEIIGPDLTKEEMITLLQFVKTKGNFNEDDIIILNVSEHSRLFNYIRSLGGKPVSTYGWQVKIPNLEKFFYHIKNIIEDRIKHSEFKRITKVLRISNYHKTVILDLNKGKIAKIEIEKEYPDVKTTDLMIPGAFLFKLLLGDRNIEEINYIIKDAIVNASSKSLIETMFPKKISHFSSYL
jgi:hypothetical protein